MIVFTWVVTVFSVIGVILNIQKKRACFYIWAVTNASWAIVDALEGIYAQSCLFTVYFCLAIWGIKKWDDKT